MILRIAGAQVIGGGAIVEGFIILPAVVGAGDAGPLPKTGCTAKRGGVAGVAVGSATIALRLSSLGLHGDVMSSARTGTGIASSERTTMATTAVANALRFIEISQLQPADIGTIWRSS